MVPKINIGSVTFKFDSMSSPSDYLPRANATKQSISSTVYLYRVIGCGTDGPIITTPTPSAMLPMQGGLYYESTVIRLIPWEDDTYVG